MSENCPLSSGAAPSFYYGGEFPRICMRTCAELWDKAIKEAVGDFEAYADAGLIEDTDCTHTSSEYSHDTLQATAIGSATRLYTTVEYCPPCETEISETTYKFECPNV
jgi:hypothetical protein